MEAALCYEIAGEPNKAQDRKIILKTGNGGRNQKGNEHCMYRSMGPHRGHSEGGVLRLSVLPLFVTEGNGMII